MLLRRFIMASSRAYEVLVDRAEEYARHSALYPLCDGLSSEEPVRSLNLRLHEHRRSALLTFTRSILVLKSASIRRLDHFPGRPLASRTSYLQSE